MKNLKVTNYLLAFGAFTTLGLSYSLSASAGEFRTISGTGNNLTNPTYGEAGSQLLRLTSPAYGDGFNSPRGGNFNTSTLPNPRTISNIVVQQPVAFIPSSQGLSNWVWQWGQIIDHDLDLSEGNPNTSPSQDFIPINVPSGDPVISGQIPFIRVPAVAGTGTGLGNPREQNNQLTAFIDASSVYGSTDARASELRTNDGTGQLLISTANNGEILLPRIGSLSNANGGTGLTGIQLFSAGDIRSNEQLGLTAVHTLLVREHNRIAGDLTTRLGNGDVALTQKFSASGLNQEDFVYQSARKVVGAEVQAITYNEFLPILIGQGVSNSFGLEAYTGYNSSVNPGVANEFSSAAFRLGHTLLPAALQIGNSSQSNTISLANAFFKPEYVQQNGVDAVLQGLAFSKQSEFDNFIVEQVRSVLFGAPTGGTDLAAVNIARGREVGLPGYASVAQTLLGVNINSFQDLIDLGLISPDVVALLQQAYTSVDQVDLWLGIISEKSVNGGLLGAVGNRIVTDEFRRTRDGDRFFYLNDLADVQLFAPNIEQTTLSSLLRNNTSAAVSASIQDNAFLAAPIPEPSAVVSLFSFLVLGIGSRLGKRILK